MREIEPKIQTMSEEYNEILANLTTLEFVTKT